MVCLDASVFRSPLWHSGLAHAVIDALALRNIGWIIARRAGAKAEMVKVGLNARPA